MTTQNIVDTAYKELFKSLKDDEINIFLCGKSIDAEFSMRKEIDAVLKPLARVNLIYPEWLFANILDKKENDLLSLEDLLAKDVDRIILPLEGVGAFCELGAFIMNEALREKLLVVNDSSKAKSKSFINLGPLKLMHNSGKGQLVLFDKENSKDSTTAIKSKVLYGRYNKVHRDILNIFSLSNFIGILIGIFQPINKKNIEKYLSSWNVKITSDMIDQTIEVLVEQKYISVKNTNNIEFLSLTTIGYIKYYNEILAYSKKQRVFSKLRSIAIWTKNKSDYKIKLNRMKSRLLESNEVE